jgi:Uma2 family endonuclease
MMYVRFCAMTMIDELRGERVKLFHDVTWKDYIRLLEDLEAESLHPRVTYDNGELEMMTVGPLHENLKIIAGRLIERYCDEMELNCTGLGHMTHLRPDLRKGVEADQCYYIATETPPMPEDPGASLDLAVHPPPDLAVEIDITRRSIARQPIYAAIGVPEIWRFDGKAFEFLRRQRTNTYKRVERSVVLPGLSAVDFNRFVQIGLSKGHSAASRAVRDWVRQQQDKS